MIIFVMSAYIIHNFFQVSNDMINLQTYTVESLLHAIYIGLLLLMIWNREMRSRKTYNSERIIEVEIRRTEEQLNRLVPENALVGIKND